VPGGLDGNPAAVPHAIRICRSTAVRGDGGEVGPGPGGRNAPAAAVYGPCTAPREGETHQFAGTFKEDTIDTISRPRGRRGVVAAVALASAAVLTAVVLPAPASAAATCGPVKIGRAGNTYQSCASSTARGKLTTRNLLKNNRQAVVAYQLGVQTNGGAVVWGATGTTVATDGSVTINATLACQTGRSVRAALRTRYNSTWDDPAYSNTVTCA
jgi:hypothetical protein